MAQRAGDRAGRHGYRRRPDDREPTGGPRGDEQALRQELRAMHGASYGRYKSLRGQWHFPGFTLQVQRVQPDPFAPASRCEVRVTDEVAGFPEQLWCSPVRARALAGYLVRVAHRHLGDSRLRVDAGGQQVLDRSACQVQRGEVVLRLGIDLPGRGRTIDGR
ncbi:ABC-ATPase domain-containing protein, partial [Saccharopolyspora kobensis]